MERHTREFSPDMPLDRPEPETVGARLKRHRLTRGWTQEELADQSGVSVSTISKLERGAPRRLHQETVRLLAAALNLDAEEYTDFVALGRGRSNGVRRDVQIPLRPTALASQSRLHHLPVPVTPLLGRDEALAHVLACLVQPGMRLLTLVGPGGSGKTRLALEAAVRVGGRYHDGVCLVSLAPVRDSALVLSAIADALQVRDRGHDSLQEAVAAYLADRDVLLLLDNFEHVDAAAPHVAALLEWCPRLQILVTSRKALRIRAEREMPVPPLAVPDLQALPALADLAQVPAVELFLQRAQAVVPDFALTDRNAAALATICCQLDGLPLAIELAAPLVRILSPMSILERLTHGLQVLMEGPTDLPERQRSLGATLNWSYGLLGPREQWLFRQLAVFHGGAALEAVEAVCIKPDASAEALVAPLAALSASSFLSSHVTPEDGTRFSQLETVREYAWAHLVAQGEDAGARQRHAAYFLQLAEAGAAEIRDPLQARWLTRLDEEHNNLQAALAWALARPDITTGLRLVIALQTFWLVRGHLREGRRWCEQVLALASPEEDSVLVTLRARACNDAAVLTQAHGDYPGARALLEQSLALSQRAQDQTGIANAYHNLGILAQERGDLQRARTLYLLCLKHRRVLGERKGEAATLNGLGIVARLQGKRGQAHRWHGASLAIRREIGDQRGMASSLNNLGNLSVEEGELDRAAELFGEALAIWRGLKDQGKAAIALDNLATLARIQCNYAQASTFAEEAVTTHQQIGDTAGLAVSLIVRATIASLQGDLAGAGDLARRSLALCRAMDAKIRIAECLETLAYVAWKRGHLQPAAQRLGQAAALRETLGAPIEAHDRKLVLAATQDLARQMGHKQFVAEWDAGKRQTLDRVIAAALSGDDSSPTKT